VIGTDLHQKKTSSGHLPVNSTTALPTEIRSGRTAHLTLGTQAVPAFDSTALTGLRKLNKSGYSLSHVTEGTLFHTQVSGPVTAGVFRTTIK